MEGKQQASIGDAIRHLTDELVTAYKSLAGARMDLWTTEKEKFDQAMQWREEKGRLIDANRNMAVTMGQMRNEIKALKEENRRLQFPEASETIRAVEEATRLRDVLRKVWKSRRQARHFACNVIAQLEIANARNKVLRAAIHEDK